MLMLAIILVAFANFFYIIDNNTYHNDSYQNNEDYAEIEGSDEFTYL
jgi:hypothetical protein